MAFSSFSLSLTLNPPPSCTCKFTCSRSHYFLFATPKPLRVSCSQSIVQVEDEKEQQPQRGRVTFDVTKKKKKRKPRPSFLDQVQQKWSVKIGSQTDKFPWQELKEKEEEEEEEEEAESETEPDTESEMGIGAKASSFSGSVSIGLRSNVVSAPWAHGITKPRKPQVDSKPVYRENSESAFRRNYGDQVRISNDISEPSYRFGEEFDSDSGEEFDEEEDEDEFDSESGEEFDYGDEEEEEEDDDEERTVSINSKGFSLRKNGAEDVKDGNMASSVTKGLSFGKIRNGNEKYGNLASSVGKGLTSGEIRNGNVKDGNLASSVAKGLSLGEIRNGNVKDGNLAVAKGLSLGEIRNGNEKDGDLTSLVAKGLSLRKSRNGNEKDRNLASSGYDSGDPTVDAAGLESGGVERFKWRRSNTAEAEKTLPEHELKRLRNISLRTPRRIKVGARGITQEIVDEIRGKWELDEVVKLKFEEPHSFNMRRTHEILENKTGGLVIWRSGSSVVLYRGMTYNLPCVQSYTVQIHTNTTELKDSKAVESEALPDKQVKDLAKASVVSSTPISAERMKDLSEREIKQLNYFNVLLDELGPRFTDWLGREPLPVDADLLPALVPDYKTPFRLLPYRARHCVGNKVMTRLRRIARTMPPHFALGRNRELQGLAKAMVKLWEKTAIAKIAIKRGVQNTCNERMAEELKTLTGGTLLSRNKEYIVFYRGNDFLPPAVTEVLKERRKLRDLQQDEEEHVRQKATDFIKSKPKASIDQQVAGTLAETKAATARWGSNPSSEDVEKMMKDSSLARHESIIRHLERKLALAKGNLTKANKAISKAQKDLNPSGLPTDLEIITEEERFLFRKMGLAMRPFLLLGRRGLYDGTIENMHLHWKFRELVKIIMKAKHFEQVKYAAVSLEAESGGILVSIDKTLKGYAIIVYRGKNYQSPEKIRPKNLLTRRQALARSAELQRRQALRYHIWDLQERIGLMKSVLEESRNGKVIDAEGMSHLTVEDSLLSEDEETSHSTVEDSLLSEDEEDDSLLSDDEGKSHSMVEDSLLSDDDELEDDDGAAYLKTDDSDNEDSSDEHQERKLLA